MTPDPHASQTLCAEILAEAQRQSEAILHRARGEAEALLARAVADLEKTRQDRLSAVRAEAARRTELILAAVPVEAARLRAARIEAVLQSIHEEVHRRLLARDGFNYRETILRLAVEAVSRMVGSAFVVKLSPSDRVTLGKGLAEEIARRIERSPPLIITISDEPAITEGGLIVQDAEGRQVWDNRLPMRLERLWPELRRQIALRTSLAAKNNPAGGGT